MARVPSRTARDYDLGIIVNPEIGDEQARTIVERITQSIASNGGEVLRVNAVGRRRLAYPIEHHRDGLYFFFDMTMPPTAVTEVERSLRVNEEVIRHLMLVRDPRVQAAFQYTFRDDPAFPVGLADPHLTTLYPAYYLWAEWARAPARTAPHPLPPECA